MRLIDADALKEKWCSECDNKNICGDNSVCVTVEELYSMPEIDNDYYKGYNVGCADGYFSSMKETWKQQYEKLCEEIRKSEREKIISILKEHYNV